MASLHYFLFVVRFIIFSGILLHIQLADLWSTLGPLASYRVDLVIEHTNTCLTKACQFCVIQLVHDCIFDILTSTYSNFFLCLVQEKLCCLEGNSCLNV